MRKLYISDIDTKVNDNTAIGLEEAMVNVCNYIVREVDSTFPRNIFEAWYQSGEDKPLRWNKTNYYWSK